MVYHNVCRSVTFEMVDYGNPAANPMATPETAESIEPSPNMSKACAYASYESMFLINSTYALQTMICHLMLHCPTDSSAKALIHEQCASHFRYFIICSPSLGWDNGVGPLAGGMLPSSIGFQDFQEAG